MTNDEIASRFDKFNWVFASYAKDLAEKINDEIPDGREKSLAMTKLEECLFWVEAA